MDIMSLGVASNISRNFAKTYNVKNFGAKGDGITNDTDSINLTIESLGAELTNSIGGELFFPSGDYMVDGIIIGELSNFSISGSGCLKLRRATVSNPTVNTFNVLSLVNCSNFTIDGLEIDGNRHCDIAWGVDNTDYAPVTQYLTANATSGTYTVTVQDSSKFVVGERITIYGGLTVNSGAEAQYRDDNNLIGLTITHINGNILTLNDALSHNYTATGAAGGTYATTYITGYNAMGSYYTLLGGEDQQNGIHVINCSNYTIKNCYCHDVWSSPIRSGFEFGDGTYSSVINSGSTRGCFENNICVRGYDHGISIFNSSYLTVVNNICDDTGWAGLDFGSSDYCTATNNIFRNNYYRVPGDNNSGCGCAIEGGAHNNILNNKIYGNFKAGCMLTTTPCSYGVDNTTLLLTNAVYYGAINITITSASDLIIGATYVLNDGTRTESFQVKEINSNVLTLKNPLKFFHSSETVLIRRIAESNKIENNEIYENGYYGVLVTPGFNNEIKSNIIFNNSRYGIVITSMTVSSQLATSPQTNIIDNQLTGNNSAFENYPVMLVDTQAQVNIIGHNRFLGNNLAIPLVMISCLDCKVEDNFLNAEQSNGIDLRSCTKFSLNRNQIKQCVGSGIVIQTGSYFIVCNNICWSNGGEGGFIFMGLSYSLVQGNEAIANSSNGMLFKDNGTDYCLHNLLKNNIVRDDGTGIYVYNNYPLVQTSSIVLSGNENYNYIADNMVSVATTKVGVNTTIVNDLIG